MENNLKITNIIITDKEGRERVIKIKTKFGRKAESKTYNKSHI